MEVQHRCSQTQFKVKRLNVEVLIVVPWKEAVGPLLLLGGHCPLMAHCEANAELYFCFVFFVVKILFGFLSVSETDINVGLL